MTTQTNVWATCVAEAVLFIERHDEKKSLIQFFSGFEPDAKKGYMFTTNSRFLNILSEGIDYQGHSGASFAILCRAVQRHYSATIPLDESKEEGKFKTK